MIMLKIISPEIAYIEKRKTIIKEEEE